MGFHYENVYELVIVTSTFKMKNVYDFEYDY